MKMRHATIAALGLSAALALAGCAGGTETSTSPEPSAATSTATASASVNSADEMFASMMKVHHQQAIEMSDILLAKDNVDAETRKLAEDIKAAQGPEIERLQQWEHDWQVMDHDMSAMGHDDGMMSPEDLQQLKDAQGPAASKLFLQQMIMHHEGAVKMAEDQVQQGRYEPAVDMAKEIISVQRDEINKMNELLAQM